MQEAEAALNSLDKASLGELKSFGAPAAEIVQVLAACMILCSSGGNIPKDLRWAVCGLGHCPGFHQYCSCTEWVLTCSWNAGKKFMGNTDAFLRVSCLNTCDMLYLFVVLV